MSPQNESPYPLFLWDLYTGTAPRASVRKTTAAPWISLNLPENVNKLPWKKNRFLCFILISHLLLGRWKGLESWVWSISLYFWFQRNNELKGTVSLSTMYIRHVSIYIISPLNHHQKRKSKFYLKFLKTFSHNLMLKNRICILLVFHKKMTVQYKLNRFFVSCIESELKGTKIQKPFSLWKKEGNFYSISIQGCSFPIFNRGRKIALIWFGNISNNNKLFSFRAPKTRFLYA